MKRGLRSRPAETNVCRPDGGAALFRPEANARRFNASARPQAYAAKKWARTKNPKSAVFTPGTTWMS